MEPRAVTYATRRSALALAQCRAFISDLRKAWPELVPSELQVTTSGDRIQDRPLYEVGGKGLFVKEIEEALLEKRADLAVHSIKDVPSALPPGLTLRCIPVREDPRDALVSPRYQTLDRLPKGARVGTSSLRRQVALRAARPDLEFLPMRGNVDTRLRKVDAGECDAIVLARAGLVRLGLAGRATDVLSPEISLPAVGQGALGIEARTEDADVTMLLSPMRHEETERAVAAERGVLIALEGDCRTPLAAYAVREKDLLWLRAFVTRADGTNMQESEARWPWPGSVEQAEALGLALGKELRARVG